MVENKKPTDILKEEHRDVLQKLDTLEDVINRLHDRQAISARLTDLASFFKTDFWTHFAKEEEALFPEMEKFIPRDAGPIGVMLMEHDDLRKTNDEFQRAVERYLIGSDDLPTTSIIQEHGSHFIGVLRDHINKEDNILFMMADMHLDPEQISTVLRLFQEIAVSGPRTAPNQVK